MSEPMTNTGSVVTGTEPVLQFSSEIMVAAVLFFFIAVVFVFFLYLYAKYYWVPDRSRARTLFVFSDAEPAANFTRNGLDASVLASLPVTLFQSSDSKEGLECSVCLCELTDGEQVRMLPKCDHGFHLDCIDMWFRSHSTCPLCRSPLGPELITHAVLPTTLPTEAVFREPMESLPVSLPTNMLFWGTQDRVTSRAAAEPASSSVPTPGMLVIDIPRRVMEASPSSMDMKTPPTSARMRSLRRLLSQGKRAMVGGSSAASPGRADYDIEQGEIRSALTTPRSTTHPQSNS